MMKQEFSAGIVVYRKHNTHLEYLLLHYAAGHWDFPKGHIEEGETKETAALRELQEETGITNIKLNQHFAESFAYTFKNKQGTLITKTVYFFIGQALDRHVTLSCEHIGYAWLAYKQAFEQLTYQNAKNLLKKAHDFVINQL